MLCVLCGSPYAEADTHCPGPRCGAALEGQRYGDGSYAVQAWCEPREAAAEPGETVVVTLTLRNSGVLPDRYEPGLAPETARRTGLDRPGAGDVLPGEERVWTIVYTVPEDAGGSDGAGVPDDADASGGTGWHDVEVDVMSAADPRITARAVFSLEVPGGVAGAVAAPGFAGGAAAAHGADDRVGRGRPGDGKRRVGVAAGIACAVVLAVVAGFAMADSDDGGGRAPVAADGSSAASESAGPTSTVGGAEDPSGAATASEGEPSASTAKASGTASASPSATRTTTKPTTASPSTTRPGATSAAPPRATTAPAPDNPAPPPPSPTSTPTKTDDGMTVVPKLYGLLVSEAQAAVKQAGIALEPKYNDPRYSEGGPYRNCRVWEFTPGEGARVPKGTVIDISRVYGCG